MSSELARRTTQAIDTRDAGGRMPPAVDGERAELRNLLTDFERSFSDARALGREMLEQFDRIDKARAALNGHGVFVAVEFGEVEIHAALSRHRELLRDPMEPPEFLR